MSDGHNGLLCQHMTGAGGCFTCCAWRIVNSCKNQRLSNNSTTRRQAIYPKALQGIISVELSDSSGIAGVSCPPGVNPILFPQRTTYLAANSEGVSYSAISEQLPPTAPAISYRHQSGNRLSTLPKGITLPMPWPVCSPTGPDKQTGRRPEDCPGWLLYCPKRTISGSDSCFWFGL
jgi:hypothetical protein